MKLICHRRNTLADLVATPSKYGVEIDVRSRGEELILHHDPFSDGVRFKEWLQAYKHGTLILNVKEDGLEEPLTEFMKARGVVDYFFLDQSFPSLVKWSQSGERRCAVRVSEYESIETAMSLSGYVDWVWVDCFSQLSLNHSAALRLQRAGFKLCLVSPELQGRDAATSIPSLMRLLHENEIDVEAVCTKRPDLWEEVASIA